MGARDLVSNAAVVGSRVLGVPLACVPSVVSLCGWLGRGCSAFAPRVCESLGGHPTAQCYSGQLACMTAILSLHDYNSAMPPQLPGQRKRMAL